MLSTAIRGKATRGGKAHPGGSPRANSPLGPARSSSGSASAHPLTVAQKTATVPATAKSIGKLIIGIDVGTTQCAIATAEVLYANQKAGKVNPAPKVKLYDGWHGFYMNHISTPRTYLYYEENGTPLTGTDLQPLFNDVNPKAYRPERLIRLWKLMFHQHQDEALITDIQAQIQKQLDKLGKTIDDLMKDWARETFAHLFDERSGISSLPQIYPNFDKLDLEIVVAVPPGRSTIAHEQVMQAFIQGRINSTAVALESEPAALFRAWVHKKKKENKTQNWVVGKRYLVADGGGGTCCFVRFRLDSLDPLRFGQEFASDSIVCGAETISDLFERLLAKKIPEECPDRDWHMARMRNYFDVNYKLYVGNKDRPIPFENPMKTLGNEFIEITIEETKSCFELCITRLVGGIRRQLALGQPVDYIVLGGGLFQNPHVFNSVRDEFKGLKILGTSNLKGAVAKGAVLSKIYDSFITNDEITRTKANMTLMEVTPKIKKSRIYKQLFTEKRAGVEWYWAATYLVKQGERSQGKRVISTENSAEDARKHYLEFDDEDLNFREKIYTFNYQPGNDSWTAYTKHGKWINEQGKEVPQPEHMEIITWSPLADVEVDFDDLDTERMKDGTTQRLLRYSLQLQVMETGTKYWAKIWSSERVKEKTRETTWAISDPVERLPLFTPQAISQSLADSFQFEGLEAASSEVVTNPQIAPRRSSAPVLGRSVATPSTSTQFNGFAIGTGTTQSEKQSPKILQRGPQTTEPGDDVVSRAPVPQPSRLGQPSRQAAGTPNGRSNNAKRPGIPTTHGGCWTCKLRHQLCSREKPTCTNCGRFGLECEYGRPVWWDDNDEKYKHIEEYKRLVKAANDASRAGTSGESTPMSASNKAPFQPSNSKTTPSHRPQNPSNKRGNQMTSSATSNKRARESDGGSSSKSSAKIPRINEMRPAATANSLSSSSSHIQMPNATTTHRLTGNTKFSSFISDSELLDDEDSPEVPHLSGDDWD